MGAKRQRNEMQMQQVAANHQPTQASLEKAPDGSLAAVRASRLALRASRLALRSSRLAMQASLSKRAFSLIELIGVLAVIVILAGAAVPVVIRTIDQAARNREVRDLGAITNALALQIVRSNTISSWNTWPTDVANYSQLSVQAISQNPRNYNRLLLVDTNGWLGRVTLPYTQTVLGTGGAPTNARMLLISCLSGTMPISNSGPVAPSSFNDIWNTQPRNTPSTWVSQGWKGNPEDLIIQRLNLTPLFHRVLLFNQSSGSTPCGYSITSINGSTNVPVPYEFNSYFLDGSILDLSTNGALQYTMIINRDVGAVFQGTLWGDQPGPGPGTGGASATNLDNIAYAFINSESPTPGQNKRGDNTSGIAGALLAYMTSYSAWANMNPCFSYMANNTNNAQVSLVPQAQIINTVNNCFGGANGTVSCLMVP